MDEIPRPVQGSIHGVFMILLFSRAGVVRCIGWCCLRLVHGGALVSLLVGSFESMLRTSY